MQESTILKLSLIISLTGILILILISNNIEIKEYKIKDLSKKTIDKDIKLKGNITKLTETPGLLIFNLNDQTGEITGIIFKEENLTLDTNQKVEITGKIKEYKNKLEIEVDELKSI